MYKTAVLAVAAHFLNFRVETIASGVGVEDEIDKGNSTKKPVAFQIRKVHDACFS